MSLVAEYTIDLPGYMTALEAAPGMRLVVEQIVACSPETVSVTFWAEGGEFATFETELERTESIDDIRVLSDRADDKRLYQLRLPATETTYWAWTGRGGVLLGCTTTHAGTTVRMRFPDRATLREYRRHCRERTYSFSLTSLRTTDTAPEGDRERLTPAQHELLTAAIDRGYFEIPRTVTMTDLADSFGISDQAASERLRRGLSNMLEHYTPDRSHGPRPKVHAVE